jgi:hypothetical protein
MMCVRRSAIRSRPQKPHIPFSEITDEICKYAANHKARQPRGNGYQRDRQAADGDHRIKGTLHLPAFRPRGIESYQKE